MNKQKPISAKRLCRVIEWITSYHGETLEDTPIAKLAQEIYRIAHLACKCGQTNHQNWIEEFLKLESALKKGNQI